MATIERVEIALVDLKPKVKRTDAIQSFVSQETPIVRVFDRDGAVGTGYSYTIGTGGSSVIALLRDHLAPRLIGRDAEHIEAIWRDLLFHTHATTVGTITALALAAIDTPCGICAAGARSCRCTSWPVAPRSRVRLYTTEGGWLHIEPQALVDDALAAKAKGFGGAKIKVGRAHVAEDVARLGAVREAVGPGWDIMTDANQGFSLSEAIRRARHLEALDIAWFEEPMPGDDVAAHVELARHTSVPIAVGRIALQHFAVQGLSAGRRLLDRAGRRRADRRHHAMAQGRAHGGSVQRGGLPALPDGTARRPVLRGAEQPLGRVHSAARHDHGRAAGHSQRSRVCVGRAGPRHRLGLAGDRTSAQRPAVGSALEECPFVVSPSPSSG